jgi:hypothetical protein
LLSFTIHEQEESDDEAEDLNLEVMEQNPEDARHYPMLATTFEEGESLIQLFEYTVSDWPDALNGVDQQNTQLRMK